MKRILSKSFIGLAFLIFIHIGLYWLFNARLTQMELFIEKWPLWVLAFLLAVLGGVLS